MPRIAFVADVHVGNHKVHGGVMVNGINQRFQLCLETLEDAVHAALDRQCDDFVVLGDLFDTTTPTPTQVLHVYRALQPLTDAKKRVVLLMGNHDRASDFVHALGPLAIDPRINVVSDLAHIGMYTAVGFRPVRPREWLPDLCRQVGSIDGALLGHFGIYSEADDLEPWALESRDAEAVEAISGDLLNAGYTRMFVGNWHAHRVIVHGGVTFTQVGALCPTGYDNPGVDGYGGLEIWDTDTDTTERIEIPGPRFVTVRSVEELAKYLPEKPGCALFVRWVAAMSDLTDARVYMASIPDLGGFEVIVDKAQAEAQAKSGAAAARSQETLRDAAIEYVGRIPLSGNVRRAEVWNIVSRALKL